MGDHFREVPYPHVTSVLRFLYISAVLHIHTRPFKWDLSPDLASLFPQHLLRLDITRAGRRLLFGEPFSHADVENEAMHRRWKVRGLSASRSAR